MRHYRTGAGDLAPTTGRLISNLKSVGIAPEDIDTVILTHGHPDHIRGNIDKKGRPAFPNARYFIWKDEWDFWISEPNLSELKVLEHLKEELIACARKNLSPIQEQLDFIYHETEILPDIRVIPAPVIHLVTWQLLLPQVRINYFASRMHCSFPCM